MDREIKFRGLSTGDYEDLEIKKGKWVYGSLVFENKQPHIVGDVVEANDEYINLEQWIPVIPESVGQYTGLKDKNGKEIYEGDIIKCKYGKATIESIEDIHQSLGWRDKKENSKCSDIGRTIEKFKNEIEIIGNVYKNKELLK